MKTHSLQNYKPLSISRVMPVSPLPIPSGSVETHQQFVAAIPPYRLNLLSTDNEHLYFAHNSSRIAVYKIVRADGVSISPLASPQLSPATTINNSRVAHVPDGRRVLILTGGHERDVEPASITVLHLPDPGESDDEEPSFPPPRTIQLAWRSAWGLTVHDGTERVAFSTNSRCIVEIPLSDLVSYRTEPSREGRMLQFRHFDNVPSVAFSPDGKWIASASVDTTFAIHDVRYNREIPLFQCDMETPVATSESPVDDEERCWCVHWYDGSRMLCVPDDDLVWLELERQREESFAGWECFHSMEDYYEERAEEEEVLFWSRASTYGDQELCRKPGIVAYNDGVGDGKGFGLGGDERVYLSSRDELGLHRDYREEEEALQALSQAQASFVPAADSGNWNPERDETPFKMFLQRKMEGEPPDNESSECAAHEFYLLVGRETKLSLYNVRRKEKRGEGEGSVDVKALDSISFFIPGWRQACFSDAKEIPELDVVVLSVKGFGVILLRIIRSAGTAGNEESKRPRLFIERIFSRPSIVRTNENIDDIPRRHVIGTAVIHRGEPGTPEYGAELWILWEDAMIECWELSHPESLLYIDTAVI